MPRIKEGARLNLYEKLAKTIGDQIRQGVLLPGEKIPSIRRASQHHKMSMTTVVHAYSQLESQGLIESRPQSGYFVRARAERTAMPALRANKPSPVPSQVDVSRLVLSTLRSIRSHNAIPFGSPYPDPSLFPQRKINQHIQAAGRQEALWGLMNDLPPGNPELIRQIARRYLQNGLAVDPNEIVITVGATEAINLCLQAVANPGDTIAVESPTYYAMLHAIERMGMRAVEIATHPREGMDLDALADVIRTQRIAACMVMPNFQNPLGFQMPDAKKRDLVALLARHDIPAIENDVYHELYYGDAHPSALKTYDTNGLVLHCASFSKSLTAAYRIGWAMAGRYVSRVEKLKFLNTLTTPSIPQLAIAAYLQNDGYELHLRRMRRRYAQQARIMRAAVLRFFPRGTQVSQPAGGYVLWVELPEAIDSMRLYQSAVASGITIGPGYMFATGKRYQNCIRLNYSYLWNRDIEAALMLLGKIAAAQLA